MPMVSPVAAVVGFLRGPALEGNARRTYHHHLAYAVLDGTAGGILLNAPFIAIKAFGAPDWQLPLRELLAGAGMLAALALGGLMTTRRKMPFVFVPGVLAGLCTVTMSWAAGSALPFLLLLSLGAMFEVVTRPAITTILRFNYPVEHRCHATGEVRKWSSLAFLVSSLASAVALHWAGDPAASPAPLRMAQVLMFLAGVAVLCGITCFRRIQVEEGPRRQAPGVRLGLRAALADVLAVVGRDRRYRRYLAGCFLDGFSQALYFPLIWAFLSRKPAPGVVGLGYDYLGAVILMHSLPALTAFATTGVLGRALDRSNPWFAWAGIRFAWGTDALLLAATPLAALYFPPALLLLPVAGRLLRGGVQGVWWILWWQVGVTHFARPGDDTSRYMGIMVFVNGTIRLLASAVGITLAAMNVSPQTIIFVGGLGVMLAGLYSLTQAGRERREAAPETPADFERQFFEVR
jgi:hypothetical protein